MKNIGDRIKERRKQLGYTQKELAKIINTAQTHISELENSNRQPSVDTLKRLAEALETTVDTLAGELSLLHGEDLDALELKLINALRLLEDDKREQVITGLLMIFEQE